MALFIVGVICGLLVPVIVALVESVLQDDNPFAWYDDDELLSGADVRRRVYGEEE